MSSELAKLKNLGCFDVDMRLFNLEKYPLERLTGIFEDMLIIQAVYLTQNNSIRYVAYSPLFERLEDKEAIPHYVCHMTGDEDEYQFTWERVLQN